jgi:hypothetical protein
MGGRCSVGNRGGMYKVARYMWSRQWIRGYSNTLLGVVRAGWRGDVSVGTVNIYGEPKSSTSHVRLFQTTHHSSHMATVNTDVITVTILQRNKGKNPETRNKKK